MVGDFRDCLRVPRDRWRHRVPCRGEGACHQEDAGASGKAGAYAVLVIPILVALVLAHTELAKLGADVSSAPDVALWSGRDHAYVKVHPEGLEHGLKLNYEGFWKDRSYNCGSCWGCFGSSAQFGSCAARSPRDLNEVVDECIAVGAVWAFLAPMWAILGAFPLLGSATVGYSMGLGRKPMQP